MAATAQNDRVGNITLEDKNAQAVDAVNKSSEIMKGIVSRPKRWNGRVFQWPLFTTNSSLGTSFKGTETFDTSIDMATTQAAIYPTGYAQPVGVSVVERSINSTPAGVIDLYDISYQYAQNSMITALGGIFYGVASGNDFDGFGNIVDDGTLTSSYAGVTRSTTPQVNATVTAASGGVIDLVTMNTSDDAATISGDLSETPNRLISNTTVWSLYDSLLEPTSRATYGSLGGAFIDGSTGVGMAVQGGDGLKLNAGSTSLTFRGKPYSRDQKSPSGKLWMVNDKWFEFKSLPLVGLNIVATTESVTVGALEKYKVSAFQFRQMMMPVNQLAEVGIFVMYGNIYCLNPNRNAVITGITTT